MSETEFNKFTLNVAYTEVEVSKLNKGLQNTKGKITQLSNETFEKIVKWGSTLTKSVTVSVLGAISALSALSG